MGKRKIFSGQKSILGFTMVELIVTAAILVMLSVLIIGYNRVGQYQIVLFREESEMASIIYRAKALSLATLGSPPPTFPSNNIPCGYGVHFDQNKNQYFIFAVTVNPGADCAPNSPNGSTYYWDDSGKTEAYKIESDHNLPEPIIMSDINFDDVFFVPPDPTVYIAKNATRADIQGSITLKVNGTANTANITVNQVGQITAY